MAVPGGCVFGTICGILLLLLPHLLGPRVLRDYNHVLVDFLCKGKSYNGVSQNSLAGSVHQHWLVDILEAGSMNLNLMHCG